MVRGQDHSRIYRHPRRWIRFVYKDLNCNSCTNLAKQGFAVFPISYRPAPETDFLEKLEDIASASHWIRTYQDKYPIDWNRAFLARDSAGGTLTLYMTAIERSSEFAEAFGIKQSGLARRR
ncbi:alpha/beta hydrolase [Bifidobacterium moukalabense]|uniref:alpha/beta hydrolase n=1 Tax=Bifidobacterium moukalabense TaxID=1333651 RepID=UPI0027D94C72|nr:alpha/beta hydrolase [Bifidobacterium moukalabense]